ncbi:hypothetical protein PIB30_043477 [Stylosanthes scabra]|uniref:Uncharacterized protein n=1 Tax=Stylosanthes scabra TaxID=79078 RepID=A0ABU6YCY8_9FABA|nr:hypothetical protein [Stylosanthes scabra]
MSWQSYLPYKHFNFRRPTKPSQAYIFYTRPSSIPSAAPTSRDQRRLPSAYSLLHGDEKGNLQCDRQVYRVQSVII